LNIEIKLFAPFKFSDGSKTKKMEVEDNTKIYDLLNILNENEVFYPYGKGSLLVIIDNKIINDNYDLENGNKIEIMLQINGG